MKLKCFNWRPFVPGPASNIKCISNVAFTLMSFLLKIWDLGGVLDDLNL